MASREACARMLWSLQRVCSAAASTALQAGAPGSAWRAAMGSKSASQAFSSPLALLANPLAALQRRAYAGLPPHTVMGLPALSPTMTQGNIASWKIKEGDQVGAGTVMAEIETDKASMEWESQEEGYIAKIIAPDGTKDIQVGAPVAVLVEEQGDVGAFKNWSPGSGGNDSGSSSGDQAAAAGGSSSSSGGSGGGGGGAPSKGKKASQPAAAAADASEQQPAAAAASKPAKGGGGGASSYPAHEVLNMPALSPTMSQGNILEWKKKVGDSVTAGDLYCEVETDKATIGWEAQEEGFVAQILLPGGSKDIPIGQPVIVIVEDKESVPAFADYKAGGDAGGSSSSSSSAQAPEPPPAASEPQQSKAADKQKPAAQQAAAAAPRPSGDRAHASPYARKLASQGGVSLDGLSGSGPGGRIVAADVEAAIKSGKAAPAAAAASAAPSGTPAAAAASAAPSTASYSSYSDVPHSQIRRITAQRLLESKQTIPHYYLTVEIQVDAMLKLREQINGSFPKGGDAAAGTKISVNDFVVKAAALALKKVPGVNASWHKDFIRQYSAADISVAVQTPVGLMTPIVKDAHVKGLAAISSDVKTLAKKAKDGKLSPAEFQGGTFTISNLGMYGVKQFAAIINPPQAAILAVGAADKKVIMSKGGELSEVQVMNVTLSCDHRVVDGAMGAEWLQAFKAYLESPYTMLL